MGLVTVRQWVNICESEIQLIYSGFIGIYGGFNGIYNLVGGF
jgi:hypothetical protein